MVKLHLVNLRPNITISNDHIHQKNMVITFHCLGGETSSYKVVRAVRFARPCDMMLSRNAGVGPYN